MEQVGDIKPARELLLSVIETNPGHGYGAIAETRLNELTDTIVQARNAILQRRLRVEIPASK